VAGLPVTIFSWASPGNLPNEMMARHIELIAAKLGPLLGEASAPTGASPNATSSRPNSLET
jgi:hypothetical protein